MGLVEDYASEDEDSEDDREEFKDSDDSSDEDREASNDAAEAGDDRSNAVEDGAERTALPSVDDMFSKVDGERRVGCL